MKCKHEWRFGYNNSIREFYYCKFCLKKAIWDLPDDKWTFKDSPIKEKNE